MPAHRGARLIGAIIAFGFVALGSKVILGFIAVYALLPEADVCSRCDGETTRIEVPAPLRAITEAVRVQSRWCPRCGESFLARGPRPPRLWVGAPERQPGPPPTKPTQVLVRRPQ